jgi:hypothetical protein
MSPIPGNWRFTAFVSVRLCAEVAEGKEGEGCHLSAKAARKFHYFSYDDRAIHVDRGFRPTLLLKHLLLRSFMVIGPFVASAASLQSQVKVFLKMGLRKEHVSHSPLTDKAC